MTQVARTPADAVGTLLEASHAFLPSGVHAVFTDAAGDPAPPFEVEARSVVNAVAKRQREFAQGRSCARAALAKAGVAAMAIPVAADRSPVWPAGYIGSITHCAGFVGAVVAPRALLDAIGFDVEPRVPLDANLVSLVCTESELHWLETIPPESASGWAKVLFSAKESIHKCIAPRSGVMLDFRDVTLTVHPEAGTFSAKLVTNESAALPRFERIVGRFVTTPEFVATTAFILALDARA